MDVRVLNAAEIRQALPMMSAVEAMKDAFAQFSAGQTSVPLRSRIEVPQYEGTTLFMPSLLHQTNDLAVKIVSVFPRNVHRNKATIHAIIVALDAESGAPVAILEGATLTAIRTGAASGAATDLLANPRADSVAIFGSGVQARTQLEAVCTVRTIRKVVIYSLDEAGAQRLAEEMAGKDLVPERVDVAASPEEAVSEADIICTATTSNTPVFNGENLTPGVHINAIGAYTPEMQEIDEMTVKNTLVVVDSREAALAEAGDLIIPIHKGRISSAHIHAELGEIVNGTKVGRTDSNQMTLFKSVGIAVQDAIAASRALQGAIKLGLGQTIQL